MLKQIGSARKMKINHPQKLKRYITRKVTADQLLSKIERIWNMLEKHRNAEA